MFYILLVALFLALAVGPSLWVKWTLKRYSQNLKTIPGTGAELAKHLIKRFELEQVRVELTREGQDHFDFVEHKVRLSPSVYEGRSLTAVAVAAHEVGHAIAHEQKQPIARLSSQYRPFAIWLHRASGILLLGWPIISVLLHLPYTAFLHAGVVVLSGFLAVLIQLIILPEEWDASFNKAMPILRQGNYISSEDSLKVRRILTACALTYVAAALLRMLFFWRWLKK